MVLKEVFDILAAELISCALNSKKLKISELNSLTSLLIKVNIAFSLSYYPSTATSDASASLSITLSPNVSLNIDIDLSGDGMIMSSYPR